jgi:hypothetical protein
MGIIGLPGCVRYTICGLADNNPSMPPGRRPSCIKRIQRAGAEHAWAEADPCALEHGIEASLEHGADLARGARRQSAPRDRADRHDLEP